MMFIDSNGLEPNGKKWQNGGATLIRERWDFSIVPLRFWKSAGCSGLINKNILMEERAPQNGFFFHLFCEIYYYPCVQCCLEPVSSSLLLSSITSETQIYCCIKQHSACNYFFCWCYIKLYFVYWLPIIVKTCYMYFLARLYHY